MKQPVRGYSGENPNSSRGKGTKDGRQGVRREKSCKTEQKRMKRNGIEGEIMGEEKGESEEDE